MNVLAPIISRAAAVWRFYADGFRSMTIGRKLWAVILVKLAVMFLVLKLFFFPDTLGQKSATPQGKAEVVRSELVELGADAPADNNIP